MDIEGLGEKNVYRFLDEGLITDPASIYDLQAEQIAELEGFGETSANALIGEIERSKQSPFGRVLYALGLPGIGYVNANAIAEHFGSMDDAARGRARGDHRGRGHRPGAGRVAARGARRRGDPRADRAPARARAALRALGGRARAPRRGPLSDKTFVLTGTLPNLSREEATKLIRAAGGKVTGSVSKNTDYLVAGDSPGTKLAKAEEVGTEILDEEGLRELVCRDGSPSRP